MSVFCLQQFSIVFVFLPHVGSFIKASRWSLYMNKAKALGIIQARQFIPMEIMEPIAPREHGEIFIR